MRRRRKQKKGRVQSGVRFVTGCTYRKGYRQSQDITEPAFAKPESQ